MGVGAGSFNGLYDLGSGGSGEWKETSLLSLESSPPPSPFARPVPSYPPGLSFNVTSSETPSLTTSAGPPSLTMTVSSTEQTHHNLK